jgi:hypothetical protein
MSVPRPLSRELLKKMFIKVLHVQHQPEKIYASCCPDFVSLVSGTMAEYFQIPELSEEEYGECLAAVYELERDGFLTQDDSFTTKRAKNLTEKGMNYAAEKLSDLKLPSTEIEQYITREDLKEQVMQDYLSGEYEMSIKKAFSLIESLLMSRRVQGSKMIDAALMSRTCISSEGKLRYSNSEIDSELESLQRIMRGTMIWFRDPRSSKTFGINDAEAAAQILVFANLHLNILDQ